MTILDSNGNERVVPLRAARDNEIKKATEERMVKDTLILQKINHAHRDGKGEKKGC
jgi:hypothetical protein